VLHCVIEWKERELERDAERGTSSTQSGRERGMKVGRVSDEIMCECVM
jgi:hypothetical protein